MKDQLKLECSCPACGAKESIDIKIPDQLGRNGEKTSAWPGYDEVTLPEVQDVVRLRPLLVREELAILERTESKRREVSDLFMRLSSAIVSIGGGEPDSPTEILKWLRALEPADVDFLKNQYNQLQPGLSTEVDLKCDSCAKSYKHTLSLDGDFFR